MAVLLYRLGCWAELETAQGTELSLNCSSVVRKTFDSNEVSASNVQVPVMWIEKAIGRKPTHLRIWAVDECEYAGQYN